MFGYTCKHCGHTEGRHSGGWRVPTDGEGAPRGRKRISTKKVCKRFIYRRRDWNGVLRSVFSSFDRRRLVALLPTRIQRRAHTLFTKWSDREMRKIGGRIAGYVP